jgi:hypothetical protein
MALEKSPRFRNTYAVLIWITVFSIKFSFFAFLKPLTQHIRLMAIYYWISVTFTVIAFGVCCLKAFVFDNYANDHHNIIFDSWYDLS